MRREDVILLALKTEEGDTSEGMHGLQKPENAWEQIVPWSLWEKHSPADILI